MKYYALAGREMIVHEDDSELSENDIEILKTQSKDAFTEESNGISTLSMTQGDSLPEGYKWKAIRQTFASYTQEECFLLARAKALTEWRNNTVFCGKCGSKLDDHKEMTAKICPHCNNTIFPRIEPCVIVLIKKGEEILLARHVQRNQNIYACIAGFMEAGETAEQAVEREIMEETGIHVKNIRYFGSQSWPFPAQLMLAFTADYDYGELKLQQEEIADAQWFRRDNCPASPQPGSIAYRLIHEG